MLFRSPDRLPGVARNVGKWVGKTRRFITQVKSDIDREMKQEELRKALEDDAGLDEIKQIMNSDRFTIDEEEKPDYLVKAIDDEPSSQDTDTQPEADTTEPENNPDTVTDDTADEQEKPKQ